jgi:TonB-linked SusC/RagA family outer membrane protein
MKKFLMIMVLACGALVHTLAQDVSGTVTDVNGETIIGASVVVKGTSNGTVTDFDGNYLLSGVGADAVLEFSYVGYESQTIAVEGRKIIDVVMAEMSVGMDEVVVIGYGSLSKKEVSSSIVQVDSKDFVKGPMNNPMEMLVGKVAGLTVNTTSAADPNSNSSLQIRGAGSLSGGYEPLYVIDGIAGGDIRNLSSQDIESITVLKDAASAAIYGTRGANGVVLVTTKKSRAEQGHFQVTYDSYFGANVAKPHMQVLSADEFRRSRRGTDYGASTDWYSEITRPVAYDINQYVNVATAIKGGSYTASLNFKEANGLDIVSKRREYGGRFAMEQKMLKDYLTLSASLAGRRVDETWGDNGQVDNALGMNPTMPVYNEDGSYYQPTGVTGAVNPVTRLKETSSNGQRMYLMANVGLKLKLYSDEHHNLNTSVTYSLDYNDLKSNTYASALSNESYWGGYKGRANVNYQKNQVHHLDWLINYDFQLDDHTLRFVAGTSWEQHTWEQVGAENRNFTFDKTLWHSLGSGTWLSEGLANMWTGKSQSALFGFFGRVNYNWRDMLFVSASIRREASTKFGVDSRWGNFPSASIAWEMMSASFMDPASSVLKSLKPRFSYGVTGREPGASYQSLSTYSTRHQYFIDGEWVVGYAPSSNANPILSWEKSESYNIGVDFDLWNRLRGSVEYYIRRSPDLLYQYTAPQPPYVHPTILVNVGTTSNRGVEVSLNGDILSGKAVSWNMGVNYAYSRTYLTKLSNEVYQAAYLDLYLKPGVGTSEYFFRVEEGGEIGQFYGYEYAGTDENGNMLIYDNEGKKQPVGSADLAWKRNIGNGAPKHTLSWSNQLSWKGFDLSVLFTGAFDYDIFNMRKYGMGLQGCGTDNVLRTAYTKDNDVKTGGGVISSYFLEDGSYFKLDNITLGYNWQWKNKVVDGLRLYVTAKNVATFTGYSGNDPSIVAVNGITPGVDTSSAYPTATQFCLGVTLKLH